LICKFEGAVQSGKPVQTDLHFKIIFKDRDMTTLWAELQTQASGCLCGRDNKALVSLWWRIY
jgi:hypothetical protein